jgi:hypothetical protein
LLTFSSFFKAVRLDPPGRLSLSPPTPPPTPPDPQAFNEENNNTTDVTLVAFEPGVQARSDSRDEGNLVAFNDENNNVKAGTLVAFEPGVEASLAFRSRDEGNLVASNEENHNTTEGTLVAFEPGVEASLAFRSRGRGRGRSRSRSRSPRREEEGLPGTKNQSLLRALTPPAKVSPPQPVARKKRDHDESVLPAEPAPETLYYSDGGVAIRPLYSPDFSETILSPPESSSTSQRGKKQAPPSKKPAQFWPFHEE